MNFNAAAHAYVHDNVPFILELAEDDSREAFQEAARLHYHTDAGEQLEGDHAQQLQWIAGQYHDQQRGEC